ncbi:MAG: deoxyribodipyrimidine photo-lyase [Spirochaetales bacterium]|nr:deoxyribodipyrimidine photo-lyase [Spirochaetales bacterium]
MVESERVTMLNTGRTVAGAYVLYWMQAAPRARDNPALAVAVDLANAQRLPVLAVHVRDGLGTPARTAWMDSGLEETRTVLSDAGIGCLVLDDPGFRVVEDLCDDAAALVCDASIARHYRRQRTSLASQLPVPVLDVDGQAVVPVAHASPKQEWSARTFRNRVSAAVSLYLGGTALPVPHPRIAAAGRVPAQGDIAQPTMRLSGSPTQATRDAEQTLLPPPGSAAGARRLKAFISNGLDSYAEARNDPSLEGSSGLSPWIASGFVSPVAVARAAYRHGGPGAGAFIEQAVIRRELCRNYAWYRPADYDAWEGLPAWSVTALDAASARSRPLEYSLGQLEAGATADPYWNAAQSQLVRSGVIHNYMRMYWGKMILAWIRDPREAFRTALYLNDHYALDGRDPNGWAGVAWCFGLHDRPWPARPVFGTVRSMTAKGLERKFDVAAYVKRWA